MPIAVRPCELKDLSFLREQYKAEMNCQVVHDSIHPRPGWTKEYALDVDGAPAGYGSVAVGGPWSGTPTLYEFFVARPHRRRVFDLFEALLAECRAKAIETQSNARLLTVMLHTFASNIRAEKVVFEDGFETFYKPDGAAFRKAEPSDAAIQTQHGLDGSWLVTMSGEIVGAGDVLYHYNPPYGDVYMAVIESYREQGLGAYLVQELKALCRARGGIPAARCDIGNLASRKTLQKAGFVPYCNIVAGDLET